MFWVQSQKAIRNLEDVQPGSNVVRPESVQVRGLRQGWLSNLMQSYPGQYGGMNFRTRMPTVTPSPKPRDTVKLLQDPQTRSSQLHWKLVPKPYTSNRS